MQGSPQPRQVLLESRKTVKQVAMQPGRAALGPDPEHVLGGSSVPSYWQEDAQGKVCLGTVPARKV